MYPSFIVYLDKGKIEDENFTPSKLGHHKILQNLHPLKIAVCMVASCMLSQELYMW